MIADTVTALSIYFTAALALACATVALWWH